MCRGLMELYEVSFWVERVMRMNLQDIYQERELVLVVIKVGLILLGIKLGLIFVGIKLGLASWVII